MSNSRGILSIIVLILVVIAIATPIMDKKKKKDNWEAQNTLVLETLAERHGEEFEIARSYEDAGYNAICRPTAHPEILFYVYMADLKIKTDNFYSQVLTRKILVDCNERLSDLPYKYFCGACPYQIHLADGSNHDNVSYDEADPFDNFDVLKYLINLYVLYDADLDGGEIYDRLVELKDTANYTGIGFSVVFASRADIAEIEKYYSNSVIMESSPGSVNTPSGANLPYYDGEFKLTKEEFIEEFEDRREHAIKFYTTLGE